MINLTPSQAPKQSFIVDQYKIVIEWLEINSLWKIDTYIADDNSPILLGLLLTVTGVNIYSPFPQMKFGIMVKGKPPTALQAFKAGVSELYYMGPSEI